jgi:general secretion pathway protein F
MRFHYQAVAADGRALSGQLDAPSSRGAYRELLRRGVRPTAITPAAPARGRRSGLFARRQATRRDHLYMLKELHVLVGGGVPLAEAVAALESAAVQPALAAAFGELHTGLRRGERFAEAFARCFPSFPAYIHRLVETGDMSGRLAEALADAAAEIEREARFRTELRHALVYPAFLVAAGLSAILFMFVFVVPRFAAIFRGKYDQLPLISYVVIAGGMWVREHLAIGLFVLAGAAAGAAYLGQQGEMRERLRAALARLPLLGMWLAEIETARWAAVLARLLENRVPLMTSLELARRALRGGELQARMAQVERAVRNGRPLAVALDDSRILPGTALSLIRVGERSGSLPEMTRSVATIYDEIVHNRIKAMLAIIEPVAIIAIGGAIGLVAVAIFLAITTINKVPGL